MKKKELLAGIYNVYSAFDKVSKHYKGLYFASTDEEFIRLHLPTVILETPLRDLSIFRIGIFNDVTGEIKQVIKKRVQTDCYLFPHSRLSPPGENVSLDKIEETITNTKNEILSSMNEENKKED